MNLLEESFDCLAGFDPLVAVPGADAATPQRPPSNNAPLSPFSAALQPSMQQRAAQVTPPAIKESLLVDVEQTPSPSLKPLLLPQRHQHAVKVSSPLRNAYAPVEELNSSQESNGSVGSSRHGRSMSRSASESEGAEESPVPFVKGHRKRWSLVYKLAERDRTSPSHRTITEDTTTFLNAIAAGQDDVSLIIDEAGSFLLQSSLDPSNITLDSFAGLNSMADTDIDAVLAGLHQSMKLSRATASRPLLPESLTNRPRGSLELSIAEEEPSMLSTQRRNDLASSTASYREHRDSPSANAESMVPRDARFWAPKLKKEFQEEEDCPTPRKASPRTPASGSEDGTGDMAKLLRKWRGDEQQTTEIHDQHPPTSVLVTEPTLTFEFQAETNTPQKLVAKPELAMTPRTLFGNMKDNKSRSIQQIAKGSPRSKITSSGSQEGLAEVLAAANAARSRTSEPLRTPGGKESAAERVKRRVEEMRRKEAANRQGGTAATESSSSSSSKAAFGTPPSTKPGTSLAPPAAAASMQSEKKPTTRERLDRIKEERQRRQSMAVVTPRARQSPIKAARAPALPTARPSLPGASAARAPVPTASTATATQSAHARRTSKIAFAPLASSARTLGPRSSNASAADPPLPSSRLSLSPTKGRPAIVSTATAPAGDQNAIPSRRVDQGAARSRLPLAGRPSGIPSSFTRM